MVHGIGARGGGLAFEHVQRGGFCARPTPGGVPVVITSPGSSVMKRLT